MEELPIVHRLFQRGSFDGKQGLVFGEVTGKMVLDIGDEDDGLLLAGGQKFRFEFIPVKRLEAVPVRVVGEPIIVIHMLSNFCERQLHPAFLP